jgi:hypothetical protein
MRTKRRLQELYGDTTPNGTALKEGEDLAFLTSPRRFVLRGVRQLQALLPESREHPIHFFPSPFNAS